MKRGETQKVHVNEEYIRKYFTEHNLAIQIESKGIGKSRSYLHAMFKLGSMDKTGMLLLCHNTGMDFEKATALPVKKELRETRTALKEVLDKENRELHDLSIYIKNSGAEARKSRETTNNNLNTIYNYIHKKGEQQLVK